MSSQPSDGKYGGCIQSRYASHEEKVDFLDSFAVLIGCREYYGASLPDGYRPDVLRVNTSKAVLFIGDAKHSEGPIGQQTQVRLQRYFRWLAAHINRGNGIGIFAICFARPSDATGWQQTLGFLAYEVGLIILEQRTQQFDRDLSVVWIVSTAVSPDTADGDLVNKTEWN